MGSLRTLKSAAVLGISGQSDLCIRPDNQPNAIYLIDRGHLRHIPDLETLYNLYGEGYIPKDIKYELFPNLPLGKPLSYGTYLAKYISKKGDPSGIYLMAPRLSVHRIVTKEFMNLYGFSSKEHTANNSGRVVLPS